MTPPFTRRAWHVGFLVWTPLLASLACATEPAPPSLELNIEPAVTGGCHLDGVRSRNGGSTTDVSIEATQRTPAGLTNLYWAWGAQAERFEFSAGPFRRLQDYAGMVGLEYYRGGEQAAELKLRPGWYFGDRASAKAWDVPVDGVTGVPISDRWNGVVGFSSARFYHHPLPIFGLVWTATPQLRIQLVYPETSVEYTVSRSLQLKLGGELVGAGFLAEDSGGRAAPVEYSSYRVGLGATETCAPGCRIALTAGVEAVRSFDAFRSTGRAHGSGAGFVSMSVTWSR